jgi:DNA processing protein
MQDKRKYFVGFNLVKGIGAARLRSLLDFFGDISIAWQAPPAALQAAGLSSKLVENLRQVRNEVSLDQVWEQLHAKGIQVLTWEDKDYPARLSEIDLCPPVLYLRGQILPADEWAVAIVGTRRVTAYGRQVTESVVQKLVNCGITVVSGLARGVDAVAHRTALQAGGRTLAVLGSGVDRIYPPEHRQLAEQISAQGALISDYAPGTPPEAVNFPPRNRIISGLSLATVVIEAGSKSGALITANFAAEQGREVFALPGSVLSPQSKGTNRLIQDGARPLLDPQEILEVLDLARVAAYQEARIVLPADAVEASLLQVLALEPLHVDEIQALANLPIEQVTATLTLMELKGMVRQLGGMRYQAIREADASYHV